MGACWQAGRRCEWRKGPRLGTSLLLCRLPRLETFDEASREVLGARGDPAGDVFGAEELAARDLIGREVHGAVVPRAVELDELPAGVGRGGHLGDAFGRGFDAEFLLQ